MESVDTVVVGAGIVGLAVARRLAMSGRDVVIAESAESAGTQTSSRNSGVVHAGIYYPTGSRRADACVRGRTMLYQYCADRGVPCRRVGKLIVATSDDQRGELARIATLAVANGVHDLRPVGRVELAELEPELAGVEALLSPSTGIVDTHALIRALLRDAADAGAVVALRSPVTGGSIAADGSLRVDIADATDARMSETMMCRRLVNCAGLGAWSVARSLRGFPARCIPARHLAKGNYFTLSGGRAPFHRLIYPVPVDGGLGVHLTLDLDGRARFGPDVEWVDDPADVGVDANRADACVAAIRQYWPGLPEGALAPDYAGIRPKLSGPGEPSADFLVQGPRDHGVPGLVNLFGIESPGLTSSLALAEDVAALLTR